MAVEPIPEGYHTISPSLVVDNASEAIEFYKKAFGATERGRMPGPNDTVAHAELEIGDSVVMLNDPFPQSTTRPPKELGGTTIALAFYAEDTDGVYKQAIDAGATSTMEPDDMFWGDRMASVTDPYGHSWMILTHIEDVSPEEMAERGKAAMAEMASSA